MPSRLGGQGVPVTPGCSAHAAPDAMPRCAMTIESDIVEWALTRPGWQQDVLVSLGEGELFDSGKVPRLVDEIIAGTNGPPVRRQGASRSSRRRSSRCDCRPFGREAALPLTPSTHTDNPSPRERRRPECFRRSQP